jgi:hypothetical protein
MPIASALPWPDRPDRLCPAEQLLLTALRLGVQGCRTGTSRPWERAHDTFRFHLGPHAGQEAFVGFARLLAALRTGARRPIRICAPCCETISADEIAFLRIVAAAQHAPGPLPAFQVIWLVTAAAALPFARQAAALADGLAAGGAFLPLRGAGLAGRVPSGPAGQHLRQRRPGRCSTVEPDIGNFPEAASTARLATGRKQNAKPCP